MVLFNKPLLRLALISGLVTAHIATYAQVVSGNTCIAYVAPSSGTPNPVQTTYNYTYQPSSGETFSSWSTRGDVEVVSTSVLGSTYTAVVRATDYGRGQVIANVATGSCVPVGKPLTVNKTFIKLPDNQLTIPPGCVQAGATYAFTVPPIVSSAAQIAAQIGVDSYTWTGFPTGSVLAYSGDGSAVTVTLPANLTSSFTVGVQIGACNSGQVMQQTVGISPIKPIISIAAGNATCKTDLSAFTLSYTVQAGVNYLWSIPVGWTISPAGANTGTGISYASAGTQTVTITPTSAVIGDVSVTASYASGGCALSPSDPIRVTRQLTTTANPISPSATGCLTPGSSVTFTVPSAPSGATLQWTLPSGWVITSTGANSIIATVGTVGGNVTVSTSNCSGGSVLAVDVSGVGGCPANTYTVNRGSSKYFYLTNANAACLPDGGGIANSGITYTWTAGSQTQTVVNGGPEVIFSMSVPVGTNIVVRIQNANNCLDVTLGNAARMASSGAKAEPTSLRGERLTSYPNPAKSELNIDLTLEKGTAQLIVTDLLGRTIQQTTTEQAHSQLDVSKLPTGTYMLRAVLPSGKTLGQKIQVQH